MQRKIRVLEVLHGLANGGIESVVLNIWNNIDKERFDVRFALATDYHQFHEDEVIKNGGIIYKTKNLGSLKDNFTHFFRLIRLLKKEGPFDVVHSHVDYFNGVNLFAAWVAGVPVRISHSHNTNSANATEKRPDMLHRAYRFIMRLLIRLFATETVGCSDAANRWMYKKESRVIYNAIDLSSFDPEIYDSKRVRKELGLLDTDTQFVTVGRIAEQKNPLFLASVINEYAKICDSFHLTWVGDGRLAEKVKEILKEGGSADKVTFLGVRRDVARILSAMDFFLFPSLWEGMPVSLIEAQAMGLPCFISDGIASEADIGGCTVIPLSSGEKAWADKLYEYVSNRSYSFKIDENKLMKYNVKNMIKEVEALYTAGERR